MKLIGIWGMARVRRADAIDEHEECCLAEEVHMELSQTAPNSRSIRTSYKKCTWYLQPPRTTNSTGMDDMCRYSSWLSSIGGAKHRHTIPVRSLVSANDLVGADGKNITQPWKGKSQYVVGMKETCAPSSPNLFIQDTSPNLNQSKTLFSWEAFPLPKF